MIYTVYSDPETKENHMKTVAIRISPDSLRHILSNLSTTEQQRADIAFALLSYPAKGEDVYWIRGNLNAPLTIVYSNQIMNEEKLAEMFSYTLPAPSNAWFEITTK